MKRFFRRSFRGRLFLALLAASLVPLLLCSAMLLQIFRLRLTSSAQEEAQQYLDSALHAMDTAFDGFGRAAAALEADPVVAAGLAKRCQVQLAYAIGVARPVSVRVDTFGTGAVEDERLEEAVERTFDLRPAAIIRDLDLRRPIYRQLAAYGHFGRDDLDLAWEKTDRTEQLKANL